MNINAYLIGYKNSKKIISASAYLISKYIPRNINTKFLNFGNFNGEMFESEYEMISYFRLGGSNKWGKYLANYFKNIDDELLIFGLDDYFMSKKLNKEKFEEIYHQIKNSNDIGNAQLSITTNQLNKNYTRRKDGICYLNKNSNYSAVTQWTIWKKNILIEILENIDSPWEFELEGTKILNSLGMNTILSDPPVLIYPDGSALSSRNKNKVSVLGNKKKDIEELLSMNLITKEDLILGQFINHEILYTDYKNNLINLLNYPNLDTVEKKYIKNILQLCLDIT